MSVRAAAISLGLGAVFVTAFAGSQLGAGGSGLRLIRGTERDPGDVAIRQLERQMRDISARMPHAPARALAELPVPASAELCGQHFPLERAKVKEALAYELILTAGRPLMPMLWMRRSPATLPMIEERLDEAGLPRDLKYVAMIESDLRETVRSPAGAVGIWQFIKGTARRQGLRVDRYLDERYDPDRATDAAIRHFQELYDEFGDWFLVLAAYNSGDRRVREALAGAEDLSYFDLYLPYETRRYVYRIMAAKLITASPQAYGLTRMEPHHVPRYSFIEIEVRSSRADLRTVASSNDLDYHALRLANPKLRSSRLPRGRHRLRLPID